MLDALSEDPNSFKGSVIVIRYEGPKGGPGMPEMLTPTSAIMGAGLGNDCALITDGRFSGGSHGFVIGHVTPRRRLAVPSASCRMATSSRLTPRSAPSTRSTSATTSGRSVRARGRRLLEATSGTLYKYIKCVASASQGCITDL